MKKLTTALVIAIALSFAVAAHAAILNVGDPAPPLMVSAWVKGEPIKALDKGKIYVVEFWATWCGPCKQTIPHLTAMAKKYKGKVIFAGINVWDTAGATIQSDYTERISKFVKDQGNKMVYSVGLDDLKATMATTWMQASESRGIPTAFVIGKDGKIATICHPTALDNILKRIIAGKFDVKAEAAKKTPEQVDQEKLEKLFKKASELSEKGQDKQAVAEIDKFVKANPRLEARIVRFKFGILFRSDENAASAYARELADGVCKTDMSALVGLSEAMTHKKTPDYDTALLLAQKAVDLVGSKSPFALAALARANFGKGNIDKAIEYQTEAVRLIGDYPGRGSTEMSMQKQLDTYKAAKK